MSGLRDFGTYTDRQIGEILQDVSKGKEEKGAEMKDRIVITQDWLVKDMKAGVPELDKLFICQKVEQVPENFSELKELCKDLKGLYKNYNVEVFDDAIFVLDAKAVLLKVYDDGEIKDSGSEVIAENRTPAQMWNIIKNLIGEE